MVKLEFTGVHSVSFFLNHRLWVIVSTVALWRTEVDLMCTHLL